MQWFLGLNPPPTHTQPSGHSCTNLASDFSLKIEAFETPLPLPLGISNDHPWSGHGYFLEPHIANYQP